MDPHCASGSTLLVLNWSWRSVTPYMALLWQVCKQEYFLLSVIYVAFIIWLMCPLPLDSMKQKNRFTFLNSKVVTVAQAACYVFQILLKEKLVPA